ELSRVPQAGVDLVALGNPHFSLDEFAELAALCAQQKKRASVDFVVTTSRHVQEQADAAGYLATVTDFGARVLTDTCWCMLGAPVVGGTEQVILTNSAKYAHYGPGLVGQPVRLAGLIDCVCAASTGRLALNPPLWLEDGGEQAAE